MAFTYTYNGKTYGGSSSSNEGNQTEEKQGGGFSYTYNGKTYTSSPSTSEVVDAITSGIKKPRRAGEDIATPTYAQKIAADPTIKRLQEQKNTILSSKNPNDPLAKRGIAEIDRQIEEAMKAPSMSYAEKNENIPRNPITGNVQFLNPLVPFEDWGKNTLEVDGALFPYSPELSIAANLDERFSHAAKAAVNREITQQYETAATEESAAASPSAPEAPKQNARDYWGASWIDGLYDAGKKLADEAGLTPGTDAYKQKILDHVNSNIEWSASDLGVDPVYATMDDLKYGEYYSMEKGEEKEALREELGIPTFGERLGNVFAAAGSGLGASYTDAERALYASGQGQRNEMYDLYIDHWQKTLDNALATKENYIKLYGEEAGTQLWLDEGGQETVDTATLMLSSFKTGLEAQPMATEATAEIADNLQQIADEATQKAKVELNGFESFLVDMGVTGVEMASDAAVNLAMGMPGFMGPLAIRSFGSGTQSARQAGADVNQQILYGAAVASVETLTEKMFDGLSGLYGEGYADEMVEKVLDKVAHEARPEVRAALSMFLGGAEEATEEAVSGRLEPWLKAIYDNGDTIKNTYGSLEGYLDSWADTGYSMLVGFAMGFAGSSVDAGKTYVSEKNGTQTNTATEAPAQQTPAVEASIVEAPTEVTPAEALADNVAVDNNVETTEKENTESTVVNTDPAEHTLAEQQVIDEYQLSTDSDLVDFIERVAQAEDDSYNGTSYELRPVSDRAASDISDLTGVDVSGFKTKLQGNVVKHIIDRHGPNGIADQTMKDFNDLARMQYVLDNYDNAELGKSTTAYMTNKANGKQGPAKTVVFSKAVNGTYFVVEAVPDTKTKTTYIVSAYMSNKGTAPQHTADANAPTRTANTENAAPPVPNRTISQTSEKSNTNPDGMAPKLKRSQTESNTLQSLAEETGGQQGELYYPSVTEKQTLAAAQSRVSQDFTGEMNALTEKASWGAEDVDSAMLIQGILQTDGVKTGDFSAAQAWSKVVQDRITRSAQALQAVAKWSRTGEAVFTNAIAEMAESGLSTEEQARVLTNIEQFSKRFDEATIRNGNTTEIDEKAIRQLILDMNDYRKTGTLGKKNFSKVLAQIKDVNWLHEFALRQLMAIPADYTNSPTLAQQLKTWQVNSQLSRLGTFFRNIGGNVMFGIQDTLAQDSFGFALDYLVSKATGVREVGFDKGWASSKARKGARDAMLKSILEVSADVDMTGEGSKYGNNTNRTNKMTGNSFNRFMSRWEQLLGYSLTTSDRTSRGQIETSIVEALMNANENMSLEDAQTIAEQVADYRLFQNRGKAVQISKGLHDIFNKIGITDANGNTFGLGDLFNPYPGVPANLAVKTLEYSPANIVKGGIELVKLLQDVHNGVEVEVGAQNQAVMDIARGMSGVPAIALLAALFRGGAIKNADDEEDLDAAAQAAAEGRTGVQINLSAAMRLLKGESGEWQDGDDLMSVSWLEPLNGFMAIASLVAEDMEEDATIESFLKSTANHYIEGSIQSILDMPVMSNISNIIDTFKYSTAEKLGEKVGESAMQFAGDAISGMIPAPISQLAKATDDTLRSTKGDTTLETVVNGILANIPGARQTLDAKYDAFGEEKKYTGSDLQRWLNTYLLPGAINKFSQSETGALVESLYEETGSPDVYPDRKAPKSFNVGKDKIQLSADQQAEYQKVYGQAAAGFINDFVNGAGYDDLAPEQKVEILKDLYGFAKNEAENAILEGMGMEPKEKDGYESAKNLMSAAGLSWAEYFDVKKGRDVNGDGSNSQNETVSYLLGSGFDDEKMESIYNALYPDSGNFSEVRDKVQGIEDAGFASLDEYNAANKAVSEARKDVKDEHDSLGNVAAANAVRDANLTDEQKDVLITSVSTDFKGFYDVAREAGRSADDTIDLLLAIDATPATKSDTPGNGSISQGELKAYYLAHPEDEVIIALLWDSKQYKKGTDAGKWANNKPK